MTVTGKRIHMVGIGGAGMSGIAVVLHEMGACVSGSDLRKSEVTKILEERGIKVYTGHAESFLSPKTELVVVSSAIPPDNPEIKAAKRLGIPVIKRGEMLALLSNKYRGIAIAGAHGKTTTTSMISLVLEDNGLDPTFIIGGQMQRSLVNAKLGRGELFVAEADESDASFLRLHPHVAVVTNVEDDHLDYYQSEENIQSAFQQFVNQVLPEGFAVLFSGDRFLAGLKQKSRARLVYYGFDDNSDYFCREIRACGIGSAFKAYCRGQMLGDVYLKVPGIHNVLNAMAAIAVGCEVGVNFEGITRALGGFLGAKRRFEVVGKLNGITVIDDYAHHPTEIKATILAARQFHRSRLIVIFQPHRYTRTKLLGHQFGPAFQGSDMVIITDVYGAGEVPIPGVTGELIYKSAVAEGCNAVYIPAKNEVVDYVAKQLKSDDLVITMGAGDIWQTGVKLVQELSQLIPQA